MASSEARMKADNKQTAAMAFTTARRAADAAFAADIKRMTEELNKCNAHGLHVSSDIEKCKPSTNAQLKQLTLKKSKPPQKMRVRH